MDKNLQFFPDKRQTRQRVLHNSPANEQELVKFPFQSLLSAFIKEVKKLEADHDIINGIKREYVNTSQIYSLYQKAFVGSALASASVNYRLAKMNPEEFPDDFLILQNRSGNWQAKYFVNRLNTELLKEIYMPFPGGEILGMVNNVALLEDAVKNSEMDLEFNDTDEFEEL